MHRPFAWIVPTVVGSASIIAVACSSSTAPELTPRALAGAYTLSLARRRLTRRSRHPKVAERCC
jgi:hypothetical protein